MPWLTRFIVTPNDMLAQGDPIARALFARYNQVRMPNSALGSEEITALVTYLDRKVLYYVDPMHPAYESAKLGKAPDCGMVLEPVSEGGESAGANVSARAAERGISE